LDVKSGKSRVMLLVIRTGVSQPFPGWFIAVTASPLFQDGDTVVHRSTRDTGRVEGTPAQSAGEYWYRVNFGKRVDRIVEDDLDALDRADESFRGLVLHGRWGRVQALRCAVAVERITHANRSTVYSFKSHRILFEPYQYKPLLKILDSPDRRLLIADEVGLGKTIEAGLILTEMEARKAIDRVLIVCPSRLRDKWREELNRKFDQDFDIFDKRSFLEYLERARQNPRRRQLRAIISMQSMRSEELRELLRSELGHVDFVVFDEAHHCRNPNTQTSELLRDLCEVGDCVLLLTATPVHLSSRDLFTLLAALRPTEFRDAEVFDRDLKSHAGVHEAGRVIRSQRIELLPNAQQKLTTIFVSGTLPGHRDPLAVQVIDDLHSAVPADRRAWVELERRVQELHPLSSIITRTRKRDVQEHAPMRRAKVIRCQWTDEEDDLYQRLVDGSTHRGWFRGPTGLGQIQRARQAASCLPAAAESHNLAVCTTDDDAVELTDVLPSELEGMPFDAGRQSVAHPIEAIRIDSKFDKLQDEILQPLWALEPNAKVLIFTFFVGTSKYLVRRLQEKGIGAVRIAGDVASNPRQPERDERGMRMRQFRDDSSILVMVSTEVGSEGLDFQFCHHLVNYDLPWNPMVVEQRIGRIDRFGQVSDTVYIHNLVVEGTVEDRILLKLFDRIKIFRESIGDLEVILGESIRQLQQDYFSGRLTPEEAEERVEQAAQAIEQRRVQLERLEKRAGELFGHDEYIRDEMNRISRLGRFISEASIVAVIQMFLESQHPGVRLWQEAEGVWGLRLTENLRRQVQQVSRAGGSIWVDRSQKGQLLFTTRGDVAFRRPDLELINVAHPLLRAAVEAVQDRLLAPLSRVGQAVLRLEREDEPGLGEGIVFLAVFAQTVEGIRGRRVLETLAWAICKDALLDVEDGERLLHLVLEFGMEWDSEDAAPSMPEDVWNHIDSATFHRAQSLRDQEQRENDALYHRRQRAIRAEYEHDRKLKEQRLRTAESRGHERILPAMRGQLEKSEIDFQSRLDELERTKQVSVRFSAEPVAVCVVDVRRA
jgi:superfamily II DNA or RNA helicase